MKKKEGSKFEGSIKSERDLIRVVKETIGELEDDYGGITPKNVLINELNEKHTIDSEKIEEILRVLKRKGTIYEPQQGHYKIPQAPLTKKFLLRLKYIYS